MKRREKKLVFEAGEGYTAEEHKSVYEGFQEGSKYYHLYEVGGEFRAIVSWRTRNPSPELQEVFQVIGETSANFPILQIIADYKEEADLYLAIMAWSFEGQQLMEHLGE